MWGWIGRPSLAASPALRPPPKIPNALRRSREHLTPAEIDRLIAAARRLGRHGHRDATMILLAYRHGLRVSELVSLRREQLDLRQGLLHVRRRKNGLPSTHPLHGPELRALRQGCTPTQRLPTSSSPSGARR
jgi:integrase